jgi:hypothetical protein
MTDWTIYKFYIEVDKNYPFIKKLLNKFFFPHRKQTKTLQVGTVKVDF